MQKLVHTYALNHALFPYSREQQQKLYAEYRMLCVCLQSKSKTEQNKWRNEWLFAVRHKFPSTHILLRCQAGYAPYAVCPRCCCDNIYIMRQNQSVCYGCGYRWHIKNG